MDTVNRVTSASVKMDLVEMIACLAIVLVNGEVLGVTTREIAWPQTSVHVLLFTMVNNVNGWIVIHHPQTFHKIPQKDVP